MRGKEFGQGNPFNESNGRRGCQFNKYSAIMFYLTSMGISAGATVYYRGSLFRAMNAIRQFAIFSKQAPFKKPMLEVKYTMGFKHPCRYCRRDIVADLLGVVERHSQEVEGFCLVSFTTGREDYTHPTGHKHLCKIDSAPNMA